MSNIDINTGPEFSQRTLITLFSLLIALLLVVSLFLGTNRYPSFRRYGRVLVSHPRSTH